MQLAVIGPGTMGLMSAARLVETGMCGPGDVRLSRVRPERRARIESVLTGARAMDDNAAAVDGADLVIVAVKPGQFADASANLAERLRRDALVVSVMTAVRLEVMTRNLGASNLVRASTNIGIESGVATTFWIASPSTSREGRNLAQAVFDAWGDRFECGDEALLDAAMVGVGSGPALVLEFARAMSRAMETHGMPPALAERGILSLLRGTAELVGGSDRPPADFQKSVVTPGGITAEALRSMSNDGFSEIVVNAFGKAMERTARLAAPRA